MKNRKLTVEECVLAYELRQEGCCWKRIALGLGVDDAHNLACTVNHTVKNGLVCPVNQTFTAETYRVVREMRGQGLSWGSVAAAVGFERPGNLASLFHYHDKNEGCGAGKKRGRQPRRGSK